MANIDDLYSGFESLPTSEQVISALGQDSDIRQVYPQSGAGRRPSTRSGFMPASSRPPGSNLYRGNVSSSGTGDNRPMTAVKGAGYSSSAASITTTTPILSAHVNPAESAEQKVRELERRVMELVEQSCQLSQQSDRKSALDRAKDAAAKERTLIRHREHAGLIDSHNLELTFVVLTNLAFQYERNELFTEALNTYQIITKNKNFSNSGRLKVNIANIYYKIGQYQKALKFYRMALDQVPGGQSSTKIKIMNNIGLLFIKMGHFADAITSFEYCMHQKPSLSTGLHLIICCRALQDDEKQKETFLKMLQVPFDMNTDIKYKDLEDEAINSAQLSLVLEAIKNDPLRQLERKQRQRTERCILTAAKIMSSSAIGDSAQETSDGYSWCVEALKNSSYADLANDLDINRAVMYLRQKDLKSAVETLKAFDKAESKVASCVFTNLSCIHFLQGEHDESERYAEWARDSDGYNAAALVNLGNCYYQREEFEKAKSFYLCALDNDASCVQALYNIGLTYKSMHAYQEALNSFCKLHAIDRSHGQVIYQIAQCYELIGDIGQATEWYLQLLSVVPSDPDTLCRLGKLMDKQGDKQSAYQYFFDSSRFYPANLEVIDWLSSYFIEHQVSEKAILYLERAAIIQPDEVRWHLLIAACHRRTGNYQRALTKYKQIHINFPDNVDALKILVRMCTDLGLNEAEQYNSELGRVEKALEVREERQRCSRPGTSYRGAALSSRSSSATSWDGVASTAQTGALASANSHRKSSQISASWNVGGAPLTPDSVSARRKQFTDIWAPSSVDNTSGTLTAAEEAPPTAASDRDIFQDDDDMVDDLLPE